MLFQQIFRPVLFIWFTALLSPGDSHVFQQDFLTESSLSSHLPERGFYGSTYGRDIACVQACSICSRGSCG